MGGGLLERRAPAWLLTEECNRSLDPLERLFAAQRAIKVGPSWIVAPRLKLVASTFDDASIQVALQCQLWSWY